MNKGLLSVVLQIGFYIGMILMFAGFIFQNSSANLSRDGMLAILFTPIAFVFLVCLGYMLKRRFKEAFITLVLLALLLVNIIL